MSPLTIILGYSSEKIMLLSITSRTFHTLTNINKKQKIGHRYRLPFKEVDHYVISK